MTITILIPRNKDSTGWQLAFTSPHQEQLIERVAINAKMSAAGQQQAAAAEPPVGGGAAGAHNKMLAIAYGSNIKLWSVGDDGSRLDVGECLLLITQSIGNLTQGRILQDATHTPLSFIHTHGNLLPV